MSPGRLALIVAAVLTLSCAGTSHRATGVEASPPAADPPTLTLSIVGTNDLHGAMAGQEVGGGLALLAGYVANLRAARARDGGATLLIDAGDMLQGTLESNLDEGATVIAAYNELGYVAAAIGNHDFDFGPVGAPATPRTLADDPRGALKARAGEAAFPFLAANLIDVSTDRPVAWPNVRPSTMVTAAGVSVGIVGVMSAHALTATIAPNVRGLRVAPLAATIAAEASRLRDRGASVVVVAAHAGGRCTEFAVPVDLSSCDAREEIMPVVRALPPGLVDVIVGGHRHAAMAHQLGDVAITQAFSGGEAFGRVDVIVDRVTKRVVARRSFPPRDLCARVDPGTTACHPDRRAASWVQAEYEGAPVVPSPKIGAIVARAEGAARAQKNARLGVTLATPLRRGRTESSLGNLFTDAFHAGIPGADVAFNNTVGGIRADLPAGPLTYGAIYEAFPFDNRLVSFRLTGRELRSLFASQLKRSAALIGLSGLRVRAACRNGELDVVMLRPSGEPVSDDDQVLVATTDFLATGGGGVFEAVMPTGGFVVEDWGLARDAVVELIRQRSGTLREEDFIDAKNPRWTLPSGSPIACGQ